MYYGPVVSVVLGLVAIGFMIYSADPAASAVTSGLLAVAWAVLSLIERMDDRADRAGGGSRDNAVDTTGRRR
jgi:hypothetical protein